MKDRIKYISAGKLKPQVKKLSVTDSSSEPAAKKPRKEFKQYPQVFKEVSIPPGEDEVSNQCNCCLKRKRLTQTEIQFVLMVQTFAFRWQSITKFVKPVKEILAAYPSPKRLEQVY